MDTQDARATTTATVAPSGSAGLVLLLVALLLIGLAFSYLLWAPPEEAPASPAAPAPATARWRSPSPRPCSGSCRRPPGRSGPRARGSNRRCAAGARSPWPPRPASRCPTCGSRTPASGSRRPSWDGPESSWSRRAWPARRSCWWGARRARRYASWGEAEISGQVSVPDPSTSTAGALAVVAPQAEARTVGRTLDEARQMVVPFAQQYGERRSRGLDADVGSGRPRRTSRGWWWPPSRSCSRPGTTRPSCATSLLPSGRRPWTSRSSSAAGRRPGPGCVARGLVARPRRRHGRRAAARGRPAGAGRDRRRRAGRRRAGLPARGAAARRGHHRAVLADAQRPLGHPGRGRRVGLDGLPAPGGTRMELLADAAGDRPVLPARPRPGRAVDLLHRQGRAGAGLARPGADAAPRHGSAFGAHASATPCASRARELPALTGGGTGLYDTALAAYRQAQRDYRPASPTRWS